MRKKQNMIIGAFILTAASIATRLLGFVFRVYLAGKIGAEGMGMYQLILSFYSMAAVLTTSGVGIAVSKLTAEHISLHGLKGAGGVLKKTSFYSLLFSFIVALLVIVFASPASALIVKTSQAAMPIRILALGLPFMAVSSAVRGYFLAIQNAAKPASAQLIEQIVKMALIGALLSMFRPQSLGTSCALVMAGFTVGEAISALYIMIMYLIGKPAPGGTDKGIIRKFFKITLPIQTGGTAQSALRLVENVLIVWALGIFTSGAAGEALSLYGMLKGMVLPLLLFPSSLLGSMVMTLIPEVAGASAAGREAAVRRTVGKSIQITILMSVIIVVILMVFPGEIGMAVYKEPGVGEMLKLLSLICPFMYLEMVTVGLLNSLGEQVSSLKYNIIDSLGRIALIWAVIPKWGMTGFLWIMVASNLFTSLLNLRRLIKVTVLPFKFGEWFIKPTICGLVSALCIKLTCDFVLSAYLPQTAVVILGIVIAVVIYFTLLFLLGCLTLHDVRFVTDAFKKKKPRIKEPVTEC